MFGETDGVRTRDTTVTVSGVTATLQSPLFFQKLRGDVRESNPLLLVHSQFTIHSCYITPKLSGLGYLAAQH